MLSHITTAQERTARSCRRALVLKQCENTNNSADSNNDSSTHFRRQSRGMEARLAQKGELSLGTFSFWYSRNKCGVLRRLREGTNVDSSRIRRPPHSCAIISTRGVLGQSVGRVAAALFPHVVSPQIGPRPSSKPKQSARGLTPFQLVPYLKRGSELEGSREYVRAASAAWNNSSRVERTHHSDHVP